MDTNQYRFFAEHLRPRLKEAGNRRVFVIVSAALRYEIAEELTRLLNGTYRFQAELSSQLGVLPSYTALGMTPVGYGSPLGTPGFSGSPTINVLSDLSESLAGTVASRGGGGGDSLGSAAGDGASDAVRDEDLPSSLALGRAGRNSAVSMTAKPRTTATVINILCSFFTLFLLVQRLSRR